MIKEKDIMHETADYWVLSKDKAYHVMMRGVTHSTSESSYAFNPDGLSIAIARCNYLQKRKDAL